MGLLSPDSISREVRRVRVAVGYFTRVPMGTIPGFSGGDLDQASKYLPWIGLGIGAIAAIVFCFFTFWLPQLAAAVLAVVTGMLLTGCFHEDGLADVCEKQERDEGLRVVGGRLVGICLRPPSHSALAVDV